MLRLCYNPAGITLHLFIVLKKRYLNLIKKISAQTKINLSQTIFHSAEIDFSFGAQNPARFRRETKKAVVPEYYKYF